MPRDPLSELSNSHSEAGQLDRALSRLQSGVAPEDSFRYIFERYYGRVLAFFVEKGLTREESNDAAQEVFLKVYRGISQLDKPSSFEGWLFSLARNRLESGATEEPKGMGESLDAVRASAVQEFLSRMRQVLKNFLWK